MLWRWEFICDDLSMKHSISKSSGEMKRKGRKGKQFVHKLTAHVNSRERELKSHDGYGRMEK